MFIFISSFFVVGGRLKLNNVKNRSAHVALTLLAVEKKFAGCSSKYKFLNPMVCKKFVSPEKII